MSDTVNRVSLDRIIGNVIGNLGIKVTNNLKDDFARWACEGVNKIGSTSSYERHECELVIRNRKASLPPNFVYLNAIKLGNRIINTTKRSFRLFNKGAKSNVLDPDNFNGGQIITDVPGIPLSLNILLSGAFVSGDLITITITTNNCGTVASNTFQYLVLPADTTVTIIAAISNLINAINGLPYIAVPGNNLINVTGLTPEVSFQIALFTDSIGGFLNQAVIQKRVPPKKNTINTGNSNTNPITTSSNLADASVAKLNTGINMNVGSNNSSWGGAYNYDVDPTDDVFSIDNGCINFNTIDGTRIGISYMGVLLDEHGWPLISEIHEDAVTAYIMYMYKSVEYYQGKLPQHVHQELKNRWLDLCGQARGDDELPNSEEYKYLSSMWMQLIPPPSKENF